jgi:hypothetical protein
MKKVVIGVVIVVAIVVVVGFVPLMDVPYQVTETYYENEPYQDVETYNETEPLEYHIVEYHEGYAMENLPIGAKPPCAWAIITLLNTDIVSGTFIVHFYLTVEFLTSIGEDRFDFVSQDYQDSKELYLEPGEIGTWEKYWTEIDLAPEDNCLWRYEVTGSKTIEKQRTVTKYREVQRERTVTHYKKGSIFEYLRSRF